MIFDFGIHPLFSILIFFVALLFLSDFMLEQFSIRLTLSAGRFQNKLFYSFGRHLSLDSLIASVFHFLSFRKRAFFLQIFSFFNVGSFSYEQILYILFGSFIGMGSSLLLLLWPHWYLVLGLLALGGALSLFRKEQYKDLGMAFLCITLLMIAVHLFDLGFQQMIVNIRQHEVSPEILFSAVVLSSLLFRTPIAFLLIAAFYHTLVGMNLWLISLVFMVHGFSFLTPLYISVLNKRKRLYFSLISLIFLQFLQFFTVAALLFLVPDLHGDWLQSTSYVVSFQKIIICYFFYFSVPCLLFLPFLFLLKNLSFLKENEIKRKPSQKIIAPQKRSGVFSIHFSLFLLRQEFLKMATLVHTILKLGREADVEEEDVNEKLFRYQGVLARVGDEIKDFCFSVGKQRAYRWHIQEILSYYKIVNQLELMVEDLSQIMKSLQKKDIDGTWEKECRFWLSLQLKIYEAFFNRTAGVPDEEMEKVPDLVKKSYECLERLQDLKSLEDEFRQLSKVFYRVTENNGSLSIPPAKVVQL